MATEINKYELVIMQDDSEPFTAQEIIEAMESLVERTKY